jgi:hypothetical protein
VPLLRLEILENWFLLQICCRRHKTYHFYLLILLFVLLIDNGNLKYRLQDLHVFEVTVCSPKDGSQFHAAVRSRIIDAPAPIIHFYAILGAGFYRSSKPTLNFFPVRMHRISGCPDSPAFFNIRYPAMYRI